MRRKENRLAVRRLFILGAGASYRVTAASSDEYQAPLDKTFCRRLASVKVSIPKWVHECCQFVTQEWLDHGEFTNFGLEEAILRQLGHLEFIDAIHPRRRKTSLTSFQYLNQLSHLMCFILRRARENARGAYGAFAAKVFPDNTPPDELKDRIITFNYDDLLEKHLFSRFTVGQIYFDKLADSLSKKRNHAQRHPFPLVVKLHGSVNWRCSKDDFENIVKGEPHDDDNYFVDPVWFAKTGTPSPEDDVSPLIMPPLPVKPITHVSLFRFLWTRAYEYLNEAEELIICGYSLPNADQMAQSMFANFSNKSVKQVTIVDPNPDIIRKWRNLLRRSNINPNAQWTYFEDFDDYVKAMT